MKRDRGAGGKMKGEEKKGTRGKIRSSFFSFLFSLFTFLFFHFSLFSVVAQTAPGRGPNPLSGAYWEGDAPFSGSAGVRDSVIDIIRQAQVDNMNPLTLKLSPSPETVNFDESTDLSATGLFLFAGIAGAGVAGNSPAAVTLDGSGKTISLGTGSGSIITVGSGVTLTLWNITFTGRSANGAALITVAAGGTLVLEEGALITGNGGAASSLSGGNRDALGSAGGVQVRGGKLVMKGGEISGHKEAGVAVDTGGVFEMSGGKISGNGTAAARAGGGVRLGIWSISQEFAAVRHAAFTMTGGEITGNAAQPSTVTANDKPYGGYGGGVWVGRSDASGDITFTMKEGIISGNTGGGVQVNANSDFTMEGGIISGNTNTYGGGVLTAGAFIMNEGTIRSNSAAYGGGVAQTGGVFYMNSGSILENTAGAFGGGVWVLNNFTMSGGSIRRNASGAFGGGVYICHNLDTRFVKTGGNIYGKDWDISGGNRNIASEDVWDNGHAVYYQFDWAAGMTQKTGDKYYDFTAGPEVTLELNLQSNPPTFTGIWTTVE